MKRVMFLLLIMACSLLSFGQSTYSLNGNTYKSVSTSTRGSANWKNTPYFFEDSKGKSYPVLINANSGRCKVIKTSQKTGKEYPYYLPEDMARDIAEKMGVAYIEKTAAEK